MLRHYLALTRAWISLPFHHQAQVSKAVAMFTKQYSGVSIDLLNVSRLVALSRFAVRQNVTDFPWANLPVQIANRNFSNEDLNKFIHVLWISTGASNHCYMCPVLSIISPKKSVFIGISGSDENNWEAFYLCIRCIYSSLYSVVSSL